MHSKKLKPLTYLSLLYLFLVGSISVGYLTLKPTLESISLEQFDVVEDKEILGADVSIVQVISVTDGDTFRIKSGDESIPVRLIAVDTPEIHHPTIKKKCYGDEAKDFLEKNILNKNVRLEKETLDSNTDRYGRLLRYVFLEDGTNMNEEIVKNGYGIEKTYVKGYKYQQLFKDAQMHAERNKLGLWKVCNQLDN